MEQLDIIEITVVATDVLLSVERASKKSIELIDFADLVNDNLEGLMQEYKQTSKTFEEEGKEILFNSFVRHYFEKVILKHYKLEEEVKPFYTEIEYV
ncbi:hypothetical protein OCA22_33505 [Bacillus cereus]|nr:hypothetical protein [Bacillus cereus]